MAIHRWSTARAEYTYLAAQNVQGQCWMLSLVRAHSLDRAALQCTLGYDSSTTYAFVVVLPVPFYTERYQVIFLYIYYLLTAFITMVYAICKDIRKCRHFNTCIMKFINEMNELSERNKNIEMKPAKSKHVIGSQTAHRTGSANHMLA